MAAGEFLGLTGNTWAGGPVGDPHPHIDAQQEPSGRGRLFVTPCSRIDFGDGVRQPWAESTTHSYQRRGNHVVTVQGESAGAGPGVFHVRVIAE